MTFGNASALAIGFLGAIAIGVMIGPHITEPGTVFNGAPTAARADAAEARPAARPVPRAAARRAAAPAMSATEPALHARLKPVLNRGTNLTLASEGFRNAEQFATLAHAARNTEVPFVLLKHRVLTERKTLAAAIREFKPELDADREAARARAEARSDIRALGD
jgi:hypothetical protein